MQQFTTHVCGGAIRDTLLNRRVKDVDYVVVGGTPQNMLDLGFSQVGADFPVFLHRSTGEEYALARTERKTGQGYNGFETDYNPNVTLEEDLIRRDLTINSLAVPLARWDEFRRTKDKKFVIDPFNGLRDLELGVLRHVSEAFAEDPVRVLRVARFAARYDFYVAPDTFDLMQRLVKSGELDSLTQERVYAELEKALMERNPLVFLQLLKDVGAGDVLFNEWFTDDRLPLLVNESLERCVLLDWDLVDRLIILTAGFKTDDILNMFERLKAPNHMLKMLTMSCKLFRKCLEKDVDINNPEHVWNILNHVQAWKNPEQFKKVMAVFSIFDNNYIQKSAFVLLYAYDAGRVANFDMLSEEQRKALTGNDISQAISELRLKLIGRKF